MITALGFTDSDGYFSVGRCLVRRHPVRRGGQWRPRVVKERYTGWTQTAPTSPICSPFPRPSGSDQPRFYDQSGRSIHKCWCWPETRFMGRRILAVQKRIRPLARFTVSAPFSKSTHRRQRFCPAAYVSLLGRPADRHADWSCPVSTLYGTTLVAGSNSWGTVYKVNTDGSGFVSLYRFYRSGRAVRRFVSYLAISCMVLRKLAAPPTKAWFIPSIRTARVSLFFFSFSGVNGQDSFATPALAGNTLYGTTFAGGSLWFGKRFPNQHGWHELYRSSQFHASFPSGP